MLPVNGGGGEIRTHGPLTRTPVFKTGAIDHSATPPSVYIGDADALYHAGHGFSICAW